MSRLRRSAALLAAAGLLSSCGISLQSLPKIGGISGPTYKLTAFFTNVVNLPANAQVRVGSFTVGQVTAIGLQNFTAVVHMRIKDTTKLPKGTTATISFDTPLGEDYVLLQPPTTTTASGSGSGYLPDGGQIPLPQTGDAPSVEDLFGALGTLLNNGGINQLQTIITQTNAALNGNQPQIRALIQNLNATVTSLAQNTPSIDKALQSIATLSTTLNQGSSSIQQGLNALGPAAQTLQSETTDLKGLFTNLDSLSSAANSIITASVSGTVETFQQLQPLLNQLTSVQSQLSPALSAIQALETYTPRAVPGNYLQLSIAATINVPAVPSDAPPLQKITVDPPDQSQSYLHDPTDASIATVLEGGLP
ncbi:MAG TPA: MlaD family protein [Acidimicrobiales bacterium]|nr:MlaD family protein [Acidimicrobiales bacterium]